jgi:hypothetical protein
MVTLELAGYVKSSFSAVTLLHVGAPLLVQPVAVVPTGMVKLFHKPIADVFYNEGVKSYL